MSLVTDHIIQQCINNDRAAQHQLYKLLAGKLMAVCRRYANSKADAEDYLQEAFIKIFMNIGQYKGEGVFEAWARRVVVNTVLQSIRNNKKFTNHLDADNLKETISNDFDTSSDIMINDLLQFIDKLPDSKKIVFNLYAIEGFSHKEIADTLNISEGTSKSQLSRAREMLIEMHKKHNELQGQKIH